MRRAWLTLVPIVALVVAIGPTVANAATTSSTSTSAGSTAPPTTLAPASQGQAPATTSTTSTTSTASTTSTTSTAPASPADAAAPSPAGNDDDPPISPADLPGIQQRAAAYRASLGAQPLANAVGSDAADHVPFVGTAMLWCTYSNPGSPGNYCNGYHPYPALDIQMAVNTPVVAAGVGQVVALTTNCVGGDPTCGGGAGNYVAIAHADGRISRYMHMTSVTVQMGQNLVTGQQIGFSGWTGNVIPDTSDTAHLHYEEDLASTGTAVDPGEMTGCTNGSTYGVLARAGVSNWQQMLWGTQIANDTSCGGPTVSGPPSPPPTGANLPPWSTTFSFGGATSSRVAVSINADGRQEIFVVGAFGLLFHAYQLAPNGFWSNWSVLDSSISFPAGSTPTAMTNADGRMEVFVLGNDHAIWHAYQVAPNAGWTPFGSLSGSLSDNPSVARNGDGRLEMFARNTDGRVWHQWQVAPNAWWSGWYLLGGVWPAGTSLATATNADGRVEVFGVGTDGGVWHAWQGSPNMPFGGFFPLGGSLPGGTTLSVTSNADGRLDLFGTGTNGALSHITQVMAGAGWGTFSSLGTGFQSQPAAIRDRSGRIDLVAMGSNGQLGVMVQMAANSTSWMPAAFLGGNGSTQPTLNANADGHIEAYFAGTDQAIYHAWQMVVPS
jgi:murein DD-endopeptidase MepM/ murein hydrolase activator NlpD